VKNLLFRAQALVQIFVGVGAAVCGMLLILFPSGTLMHMTPGMLEDSPFHDFLIPGIILFLVNGAGQLLSGVLTIRRHPIAGYLGAILGIGLMIWIFVQVNMIGGRNILQYGYFFLGVLETALAFLIQEHLSSLNVNRSTAGIGA
jgi:hypothetical protein